MIKNLNDQTGSILTESTLILAGVVLPILIAATSINNLLEDQNRLELTTREASRSFILASSNQSGINAISAVEQRNFQVNFPVKLTLTCFDGCDSGTKFQITGALRSEILDIPLLPDLVLNLNSKLVATIDRFVER